MWRELEEEALYIGLDLKYFWNLNPKQYQKYLNVYYKKNKKKIRQKDYLNHLLGQYISFAFNNPSRYPEKPFLAEEREELIEMEAEEMEKQAKINTTMLGGVINDS
ncbi:MAG: hypothetical protein HFJ45_02625 [Clostridia bacterium]|nr:hypothetical protein [Clostridia bacterium]